MFAWSKLTSLHDLAQLSTVYHPRAVRRFVNLSVRLRTEDSVIKCLQIHSSLCDTGNIALRTSSTAIGNETDDSINLA